VGAKYGRRFCNGFLQPEYSVAAAVTKALLALVKPKPLLQVFFSENTDPALAGEKRGQIAMMEITRIDVQERSEVATGEDDST